MDTTTEKNYLAEVTHQLKQKITEVEAALNTNEDNYKGL